MRNGQVTPRIIFIDTDGECRSKLMNNFTYIVTDKYSCEDIYTRGYNTSKIIKKAAPVIDSVAEKCDNLEGFLMFNSASGGHSGVSASVLEHLVVPYSKKPIFQFFQYAD